jgi:hypothetical protein
MMYGWPTQLPSSAPLAVLDKSPHAGFVVSEQLEVTYCNRSWDCFAHEQGGSAAVLARNIVSRNLMEFVAPDLQSFYRELFAQARARGRPVGHDYECSSASVFRLYRMQIYPLQPGQGFVVENSLRVERPHDRVPVEPDDTLYKDSEGIIHACANCRRTRRTTNPAVWDWVPAYLESHELNISHGVCPMCLEFYYRPIMENPAAQAS